MSSFGPSFGSIGLLSRLVVLAFAVAIVGCDDDDDDKDGGVDAGVFDSGVPTDGGDRDGGILDAGDVDGGDIDGGDIDGGGERPDAGPVGGGAASSAQITAVLEAPDGISDLAIDDAVVSYVRPEIGSDPPGFFLQAERMGPAVFVRVDPASLTPPAEVGQVVDLRATDLSDPATNQDRREILSIADWNVDSSGHDVGFLVQDVSTVDVVAMLDDYTAELITTTFQIRGDYRFAGSGYQQITVDTPGVGGSDAISLRIPEALVSTLDLEANCEYTLTGTPLWRIGEVAQISAWEATEVTAGACDAPVVDVAAALNERTIIVRLSRQLDASSVMADGSQIMVEDGAGANIPVTGAVAGDTYLVVTMGADIMDGAFYTITVGPTVLDNRGTGVDPAMASAPVLGYSPHLVINEIDYDQPGADTAEFIEIYNPSLNPISLAGVRVSTINISGAGAGSVLADVPLVPNSESLTELPAGGYLLVLTPSSGDVTVPAGVPTVMLGENLQNDREGVVVASATDCHDSVFYEGLPTTPATEILGCEYESVAGTDDGSGDLSLSRIPNGADFQESTLDFRLMPPTPGASND